MCIHASEVQHDKLKAIPDLVSISFIRLLYNETNSACYEYNETRDKLNHNLFVSYEAHEAYVWWYINSVICTRNVGK